MDHKVIPSFPVITALGGAKASPLHSHCHEAHNPPLHGLPLGSIGQAFPALTQMLLALFAAVGWPQPLTPVKLRGGRIEQKAVGAIWP